jgi:class 3 adenylate cyclase
MFSGLMAMFSSAMEMHQVRYFLATVSELNFTKAAEKCNVTQPSLTRAIKQLEDELGGDLFRRERPQAQLTELGQRIPHDQYARVMRHYIARLSGCVTARSGDVLDPQGDGFVCVWRCSGATRATRLEACLAALDVLDAADSLDREAGGGIHLPTRVAATMGMVTLHSDGDRGTFQAYGDPLNLAARLRDLNKQFGTRFIASADVVEGLEDALLLKPLIGDYVLKGFARPPAIFEVRRVTTTVAHHARA